MTSSKPNINPVVLVVEDDDVSYFFMESVLKKTSAKVFHAVNGLEAIDICKNNQISVVLMDLKMPVMDGFEATRNIKALMSELPVIAVTAYAFSGDEKLARDAGCDGYIAKPFKKEILLKKLEIYGITKVI